MKKIQVIILKVNEYDVDYIKERVSFYLKKFDFLDKIDIKRVFLKPNLLLPADAKEAITTHPAFIEAIGKIFQEAGYEVYLGDNPSIFITEIKADGVYKTCGVKNIAQRNNFKLVYPERSVVVEDIPFSWWVKESVIINLPKLKTHNLVALTGAVKNLYGCISGLSKSYFHRQYPKSRDFVKFLLKLYKLIKPPLNIVDGIIGVEGQGPGKSGTPRKLGVILIGTDALYVDYVISEFVGLSWRKNPLLRQAYKQGLLDLNKIEVISELGKTKIRDFKFPSALFINYLPQFVLRFTSLFFHVYPKVNISKCVRCQRCVEVCPNRAIKIELDKAIINYKLCLLCMCCSEVCKEGAIIVEKSFLLRIKEARDGGSN